MKQLDITLPDGTRVIVSDGSPRSPTMPHGPTVRKVVPTDGEPVTDWAPVVDLASRRRVA